MGCSEIRGDYASEIERLWDGEWGNKRGVLERFERKFFPGGKSFERHESVRIRRIRRKHHEEEEHEHDVEEATSGGTCVVHRHEQHPCVNTSFARRPRLPRHVDTQIDAASFLMTDFLAFHLGLNFCIKLHAGDHSSSLAWSTV